MKKITFFRQFLRETRFGLVLSCIVTALALVQSASAVTNTAVAAGYINTLTTWSATSAIPLPTTGNTDTWSTGNNALNAGVTPGGTFTFYGGTVYIPTGGTLQTGVRSPLLYLNNLILDGGKILSANNNGPSDPNKIFTLDLGLGGSNHTFTLNSGSIVTTTEQTGTPTFKNCSLAGSGTIFIAQTGINGTAATNWVEFQSTVTTTGFTGTFTITPGTTGTYPGATLKLSTTNASGTFGISIPAASTGGVTLNGISYTSSVPGNLWFNPGVGNTLKVTRLNLGGTDIAIGTYTLAQLQSAGYTTYLNAGCTGSIQVTGPPAPTSVVATNVNGVASVTFAGNGTSFTVTPYNVTTSTTGTPVSGTSSPITVSGLTSGNTYRFTVTATIAGNTGPASTASTDIAINAPGTITAVAAGAINALATWSADSSIPLPVAGDANIWSSNGKSITSTGTYTFNGGTFLVAAGPLIVNALGTTLTMNNLSMTSSVIYNSAGGHSTVDLQGKTLTLNGGAFGTVANGAANRNLLFQNCTLAGSGTVIVYQLNAGAFENWVELTSSVNTTGFTGTFTVQPGTSGTSIGGELKLNDIATASFNVNVPAPTGTGSYTSTVPGKLYFTGSVNLKSLNLGGTNIGVGTYSLSDLNSYMGGNLTAYLNQASTGTITVTDLGTGVGLNHLVVNHLVVAKNRGFQLNNSTSSLQVYNSVGACIINRQNVSASTTIALPNTGMYLVKAKTENGNSSVQKIMIK